MEIGVCFLFGLLGSKKRRGRRVGYFLASETRSKN